MKRYSPLVRCLLSQVTLLALVFSSPFMLKAQSVATITGVITDQTGAVIPDVNVTLQNPQTGATYKTVSNTSGSYTLSEVKPGPGYKIEFTHDGFNSVVVSGLYMNVDVTRTQNARLAIGAAQQTVQVSAANQDVTLNTTDATVGNNFQVQFLDELPVQERSTPRALFTQQPGVTLDGAVTGARVDQSNVVLDGLDVNDNATGGFGLITANAPVDSVQEFRGVSAGPLSSAGAGGGGQFELVTRSGTNSFHGSVVEYHRDTDLEANDWFNNNEGVGRPPLIRNQFGGNIGGPILKDKLFFFFDYNGRRDTISGLVLRTVPITSFRNGTLTYNNASGTTSTLSPGQITALDPQGIGFNPGLASAIQSRYPVANDLTGDTGDLLNTAGFRFNAPEPFTENDFAQRVDYTLNSRMKIYGVGHFTRTNATEFDIQFPGDPQTAPFIDQSYTWVVAHTWTISNTMVNQVSGGETFQNLNFPVVFNPTGTTQYGIVGGNPSGGAILSNFYLSAINAQGRTYPVPVIRDDFSWDKGRHNITIGGSFKWPSPQESAILNYNSPTIGLGGNTQNLTVSATGEASLRPADIATDGVSQNLYDEAFALALAPITRVTSTFNYNAQGVASPQGSGLSEHYRYYEPEIYVGDTWKVTPSLTISYGLRYQLFTVPYEVNGIQSRSALSSSPNTNVSFDQYFALRNAQSQAGISGNASLPFVQYTLGGKANNAPGYFNPNRKNFAPRFAFAYNPSFDRKTVFSGGAGIVYDHTVVNALQFQQSQASFLFQAANTLQPGSSDPYQSLKTDPRFGGLSSPPAAPSAPSVKTPFTPFVTAAGVPTGLANQNSASILDPTLKNPYSIQFNFGFQHEFPQGYILKTTYVGRLGRRLLAQADGSQLIDFPDQASGQMMSAAFANMVTQLRQGAPVTAQPWFENILPPGAGVANGFANNTQLVAAGAAPYPQRGDFADTMFLLSAFGLLPPNVGLASQFAINDFYTNKGFSGYNGLLTTLHKNAGYGLQFDINYTWAHSIDNTSFIANQPAGGSTVGFICEAAHPRVCRGNSDFDVANYLSGNFIYNLPFGRGASYLATIPLWANEAIGGWTLSGLPSWHTGPAYNAVSNAFVAGFSSDAPATIIGPLANLKTKIHGGEGAAPVAYTNQAAALAAVTGPTGFDIGSRNNLRGPGYFDMDLALGKTFPLWENLRLKFRTDAFNAFNHTNFNPPTTAADITESSGIPFGTITSDVKPPSSDTANRVLQVSLRLEF